MENIITSIILVIGAIILYWMYIKVDKEGRDEYEKNTRIRPTRILEQDEMVHLKSYSTVNKYLVSIDELELDLAEDITQATIDEAYLIQVKRYLMYLETGQEPPFKLYIKEASKEYLNNFIKEPKVQT